MYAVEPERLIHDSIILIDSRLDAVRVTAPFDETIRHLSEVYHDLADIGREQSVYQNTWAYEHAHIELKTIISTLFSDQVLERFRSYSGSFRNRRRQEDILKKFSAVTDHLSETIHKTSTSPRLFRTTGFLIALTEALISLIIVLVISRAADMFDQAVPIPQLSLLFIGIFGVIRLLLEQAKQRFLMHWRWTRYLDTVDKAFEGISVLTAISCILAYHVKRGTFLEEMDDLLEKGVALLGRRTTPDERRRRRATHKASRRVQDIEARIAHLRVTAGTDDVAQALGLRQHPIGPMRWRRSSKSGILASRRMVSGQGASEQASGSAGGRKGVLKSARRLPSAAVVSRFTSQVRGVWQLFRGGEQLDTSNPAPTTPPMDPSDRTDPQGKHPPNGMKESGREV